MMLPSIKCVVMFAWFVRRLSKAADMDHHWVAKAWLSDVGLPQYSQAFHNHLVDGRMLNSLTRHELERHLGITKKLHQVSLLLGIELLHLLNFDKEVRMKTHRAVLRCNKRFLQDSLMTGSENQMMLVRLPGPAGSTDTV